jgi:hypothetical protein
MPYNNYKGFFTQEQKILLEKERIFTPRKRRKKLLFLLINKEKEAFGDELENSPDMDCF